MEEHDLSSVTNPELIDFMKDLLTISDKIKTDGDKDSDIPTFYGGTNLND